MMNTKKLPLIISVFFILILTYSCINSADDKSKLSENTLTNKKLIERGRYLVTTMGCNDCHSPKIMGPAGPQIDSANLLSGYPSSRPLPDFPMEDIKKGFVLVNGDMTAAAGPWGISYSANLTSDPTGIGMWKEEQFKNAITHGKYKGLEGGRPLMPPMPWQNLVDLKDEDTKAIFAYLMSTRPVKNLVPEFAPAVH